MDRVAVVLAACGLVVALVGVGALAAPSGEPAVTTPVDGGPAGTTLTGANVSVGVVDPTGFAIERVDPVAARAFGGRTLAASAGSHGTRVAGTVRAVAPDADLYLAAVRDGSDFRAAVAWLADRDVDVLVVPTAFYGKPGDGTAASARVAAAVADDAVVVTAAGNVGAAHWRGPVGENATLRAPGGDPVRLVTDGGRVEVWLGWRDPGERYRLELRRNGSVVARSRPFAADLAPNERLVADLPAGSYAVGVSPLGDGSGPVSVEAPGSRLVPARPNGSLTAPATARGVLVVGAYAPGAGVPAYSSRGPTVDGRTGVDVVVATGDRAATAGTSYAAARAGGVAALLLEADPGRSPAAVERRLELTARDVGPAGRDPASGYGVVRPGAAVRAGNFSRA